MTTIPMSEVSMDISAEDFITSETAKLTFAATFALTDTAIDSKAEVLTNAKQIVDGEWFVTNVQRNEDTSGIENVTFNLSVRVKEREVGAIKSKIRAVNRPGLKFVLVNIDYSPTAAQIQDGNKGLRRKVYLKANEELEVLNEVMKTDSEQWMIGSIDFRTAVAVGNSGYSKSNNLRASVSAMYESASEAEEDGGVTQRLTLSATVNFVRKIYTRL